MSTSFLLSSTKQHFRHMRCLHMISKLLFLFHYRFTLRAFPSYASSSHDFEITLFVFPQNHTMDISVICFEFTCFRNFYACFTTDSHDGHFRHMLFLHMMSTSFLQFHYKIAFGTFPSYASSSHVFEKNLFVFPHNHTYYISVICIIFT